MTSLAASLLITAAAHTRTHRCAHMHALTPTVQNMQVHNADACSRSTHVCRSQQAHSSGSGILKPNKVAESHLKC